MNKQGFTSVVAIFIIAVILTIAFTISFLFSSSLRLVFIGAGVIIGGFVLLNTSIKTGKNINRRMSGMIVLIFGIGIILVLIPMFGFFENSVLSASNINVGTDGKVYWTFYASANKPNEQYIFTYNPNTYTKTDGTEITPQSALTLVISPKQPQCIYQTQKHTKTYGILGLLSYDYYVLNNPEKRINIEIADRDSKLYALDGTTIDAISINDKDGLGKVTVETQGILGGKYNCPSYSNVAIVKDSNNNYVFKYKNEIDDADFFTKTSTSLNTAFTNSFIKSPTYDGTIVIGEVNFGYPTFTITADQDYFNSISYNPPKQADPNIDSISIPKNIIQDGSSSAVIKLSNNGEKGLINVKATSNILSIIPSSTNTILDKTSTLSFNLKANNNIQCGSIDIEVCSVDQFSSIQNCDVSSKNICVITSTTTPKERCGDNICQDFESFNTCPTDCKEDITNNTNLSLNCKSYETEAEIQSKDYKIWNYIGIGNPEVITTKKCVTADWVKWLMFFLIIGIIIMTALILILGKPKKRRKK